MQLNRICDVNVLNWWIVPEWNRSAPFRPVRWQRPVRQESLQPLLCVQRCDFRLLSLEDPWRSYATFLDLSLSPLTAARPPSSSPSFPLFTPSPSWSLPVFLFYPTMWIRGSHFHMSGTPVSVTAPSPPVSLETASLVWVAAGEAIGVQLSPTLGTVR